jgi:hypothetical protein
MTQRINAGFSDIELIELSDISSTQQTQEQSEALQNLSQQIERLKRTLPEIQTDVDALRVPKQWTCNFIRTRLDSLINSIATARLHVAIAFRNSDVSEKGNMLMQTAKRAIEDMEELKNRVPELIKKTPEDLIGDDQQTNICEEPSFEQSEPKQIAERAIKDMKALKN